MKSKRIIPVLILLIIIVYLAIFIINDIPKNKKDINIENNVANNTVEPVEEPIDKWVDDNPITVGLYYRDESINKRVLKEEYTAKWVYHKDIISFNTFLTNEEQLNVTNIVKLYEEYASKYDNIDDYRIGYIIEFNDNKYQILRPKDTEAFYDTLEIYLYDAVAHKNDSWYSHTTDAEFNKNTLLQGIKLTAGKQINDITTDIKVTVFTYDEDDFDENNLYKGKSSYSLIVKKA